MRKIDILFISRTMILILSSFLSIFRSFIAVDRAHNCTSDLYGYPSICTGNAILELALWVIVIGLILIDLIKTQNFKQYWYSTKKIIPFLILILLAWSSLLWTLNLQITLTKTIIFSAASITAIYVGMRYSIRSILKVLAVFFGIISILCFLMILLLPDGGMMNFEPYNGAWRGIFRNKNYLGTFLAYGNIIFLYGLLINKEKRIFSWLTDGVFYAFTLILVVKSDSAAGLITLIFLTILTILLLVWGKVHYRLNKKHYYILLVIGSLALAGILTNLDRILLVFNRNVSLTGRIPMWQYLFDNYISNKLLLGHGYGVVWSYETFRTGLQSALNWGYPLVMGDNGLVDVLLHLGVIGVVITLAIFIFALIKVVAYALQKRETTSFLPIITVAYATLGNITLSMLIEFDYFVWMLLIVVTVIAVSSNDQKNTKIIASDHGTEILL